MPIDIDLGPISLDSPPREEEEVERLTKERAQLMMMEDFQKAIKDGRASSMRAILKAFIRSLEDEE